MARSTFGGGIADWLFDPVEQLGRTVLALPKQLLGKPWPRVVYIWDAPTGGNRLTDLLVGGVAASEVVVDVGQIPTFDGPDGVTRVWASEGVDGPRTRLDPLGLGGAVAATWDTVGDKPAAFAPALVQRGLVASSTSYTRGDVVTYRGRRALVAAPFTTDGNGLLDESKLAVLSPLAEIYASDWGVRGNTGTNQRPALVACLDFVRVVLGGARVVLPYGNIGLSTGIELPTMTYLRGQGPSTGGTNLELMAGADSHLITFHTSTGPSDANAFWGGVSDMRLYGSRFGQGVTTFHHGINVETNPVSTAQTADPHFDPAHVFRNLIIKNFTGHGFRYRGRSDASLLSVRCLDNGGAGFVLPFDTRITDCDAAFNYINGIVFTGSSVQGKGLKSYNNGRIGFWSSTLAYGPGAYVVHNGAEYRAKIAIAAGDTTQPGTDAAKWVQVWDDASWGDGFTARGDHLKDIVLTACSAQQNSGSGLNVKGASVVYTGAISQTNFDNPGGTSTVNSSNPRGYASVLLEDAHECLIDVYSGGSAAATPHLRVLGALLNSDIRVVGDTTMPLKSGDSIALGTNGISFNGVSQSPVDVSLLTGTLPVSKGGTGKAGFTSGGVLIADTGTSLYSSKLAPSGSFVGTTDTQTLSNKTLAAPVITGTPTGLQSAHLADLPEFIQDTVAGFFAAGSHVGISFTYDDAGNKIGATVTGGGGGTPSTPEEMQDAVGAIMAGVGLVTVSYDDAANSITISTTATQNSTDAALRDRTTHTGTTPTSGGGTGLTGFTPNGVLVASNGTTLYSSKVAPSGAFVGTTDTQTLSGKTLASPAFTGTPTGLLASHVSDFTEAAQDAVAALLQGASGVTLSYNDAANTLTITGGGAGGLDAEAVRDAIGVALIGAGVISVAVNDAADTITISSSATQNSTDAQLRDRSTHTGLTPLAGLPAGGTFSQSNSDSARLTDRTDLTAFVKGGSTPAAWLLPGDIHFASA